MSDLDSKHMLISQLYDCPILSCWNPAYKPRMVCNGHNTGPIDAGRWVSETGSGFFASIP